MTRAAKSSSCSRAGRILGSAVLTCGLLGGCGGNTPSAPTTPTSTPTPIVPSPEPTSGGFLHVSHGSTLITYAIDGVNGQLRESATQRLGDMAQLTGEPQGRFVFAAYDGRNGPPPPRDASVVAYVPDPSTGSLSPVSEATARSTWWYWLGASSTRVYGTAYSVTGHYYPALASYAVGSDGQLGSESRQELERDTLPRVALDPDADPDVFYSSTSTGGVTAHFVEPDGRLRQMGGSHLCVASAMYQAWPLVAVRGFLFSSAEIAPARPAAPSRESVCSWEGPRLAPRANLGLEAYLAAAFVPRAPSSAAALVAMVPGSHHDTHRDEHHEVRLSAMGAEGDLASRDAVTGPWSAKQVLFHPSGRFLYVSYVAYYEDSPIGLDVYSIDDAGHLELVQTLEDGGGRMAVTLPKAHASAGSTD